MASDTIDNADEHSSGGLDRLTIAKGKRPTAGRSWLVMVIVVVAIGAIGGGAAWWYLGTTGANVLAVVSEKPVPVRLYEVPRRAASRSESVALVANGKIVSDVRVNVATKVSGQIISLHVEQGDSVQASQVLARIEDDVYRAQRDEARATSSRLKHSIQRAEAEHRRQLAAVNEAKANLAWRAFNYDRLERLEGSYNASDVELVQSRYLHEAAVAALAVAEASAVSTGNSIDVIRADLEAADARLRLWQKRLDDCAIRAPISGIVLERNAQVGDFLAAEGGRGANANAQLVSIADMTRLRVEIDVSERDIHRISAGQTALITPDACKHKAFDGHVMWVDPIGDYARATVQVKVRVEQPTDELRIEGSAKVEFLGSDEEPDGTATGIVWLPLKTVKIATGDDPHFVFTIADDRAVSHPVSLGARNDKSVEVTSGVHRGMTLVADRLDKIEDGILVTVQGVRSD